MRYISGDYLVDDTFRLIQDAVLILKENGSVEAVLNRKSNKDIWEQIERSNVEKYNGIVSPGFVNTHCHLELSYLKNQLREKRGFAGFIKDLEQNKSEYSDKIAKHIAEAEQEMLDNGIVAVGDISNTTFTLQNKANSRLYYHTFVECYASNKNFADKAFNKSVKIYEAFKSINCELRNCSITPHAPYSVSATLLNKISQWIERNHSIYTLHNQESMEEDAFFRTGTGELAELIKSFGTNVSEFVSGNSSIQSVMKWLPKNVNTLLVHNTYSTVTDVQEANKKLKHAFWCLCPNANLYIEGQLPDIVMLSKNNCRITLGTDSLASNHSLSILEEMKTIQEFAPAVPLSWLFEWACLNGAQFLNIDAYYGSFTKGKRPGVILIKNVDLKDQKLMKNSEIEVLT